MPRMENGTLTSRLLEVLDGDGPTDVSRKVTAAGHDVSPQAAHKWLNGHAISEPALLALCRAYHCEPAYVRYGVGPKKRLTNLQQAAADLLSTAPSEPVQLTLDFLEYQLHRGPAGMIASEQPAHYMALIDQIRTDMDKRNGKP